MSASVPTDICFSLTGLLRRGGHTGPHKDGWGIAFYEGQGCRSFHDPAPSAQSPIAEFVRNYPIKSRIVLSHIRRANRGRVSLANTHPFSRELWGRVWTFAHNGQLRHAKKMELSSYRPVGTTDSEHAFCTLLGQLRQRFGDKAPSSERLWPVLDNLVRDIADRGVFNILMSDGTTLFAFRSTDLVALTRRDPFRPATLLDTDLTIDFARHTSTSDIVTIIATRPLTRDEEWLPVPKSTLVAFRDGVMVLPRAGKRAIKAVSGSGATQCH